MHQTGGVEPAGESDVQVWRPTVVLRVACTALGVAFVAFGALLVVAADPLIAGLLVAPLFILVGIVFFRFAKMTIKVSPAGLDIRNLGGVEHIAWSTIRDASAGYNGITLWVADMGRSHQPLTKTAMAVQKSNIAQWLNLSTRADRLVGVILERASAVSAPGKSDPESGDPLTR